VGSGPEDTAPKAALRREWVGEGLNVVPTHSVIPMQVDPDAARADVRRILDDARFRSDPAPRPFRGPLRWLGERLDTIGGFFTDAFGVVPWFVWIAAGLLVTALVLRTALRRGRRVHHRAAASIRGAGIETREDPGALEAEAGRAEQHGDLERAVRLRFRAGLLRLHDRGVIDYQPSLTTSEVRALLGSDTFDELARAFEQIAYGRRPARPPDVAAARADWPKVVAEGRAR
jgi:hypothetical protein